jgi:hypothetical protein
MQGCGRFESDDVRPKAAGDGLEKDAIIVPLRFGGGG